MILKAFSSRHDLTIENLEENLNKTLYEEEPYTFIGGFTLHEEKTDEILATISGIFFDENKILDENENIVDIADMIDEDVYKGMQALFKSKLHNEEIDNNKIFLSLFSCYIQRFYVYPKHRNKGIASYLFKNLEPIFSHCFNTPIHSLVIYPRPQQPNEKNQWENTLDKDGSMLKKMINQLKKEGYRKIGKTNYYAKNYAI